MRLHTSYVNKSNLLIHMYVGRTVGVVGLVFFFPPLCINKTKQNMWKRHKLFVSERLNSFASSFKKGGRVLNRLGLRIIKIIKIIKITNLFLTESILFINFYFILFFYFFVFFFLKSFFQIYIFLLCCF